MTAVERYRRSNSEFQVFEVEGRRYRAGRVVGSLPQRVEFNLDGVGVRCETPEQVELLAFRLDHPFVSSAALLDVVQRGAVIDPATGQELEPKASAFVRALMLGGGPAVALREDEDEASTEPDWLLRGVFERGTVPQLVGPSKGGKSVLVFDAIRAVLTGGRWMGRFEAGPIHPRDLGRGIDWINTEVPRQNLAKYLRPLHGIPVEIEDADGHLRTVSARSLLRVHSLRDGLGGPRAFAIWEPEVFETWRTALLQCSECIGAPGDTTGPLLLVADNGTSVLRSLRVSVMDHIGEFAETFRDLVSEAQADSGWFITHSDKAGSGAYGGVLSSAASDGEMLYRGTGAEARYFSLSPRLGAVDPIDWTRVVLDPDTGLPVMVSTSAGYSNAIEQAQPDARQEVLEKLREAEGPLLSTAITGTGQDGARLRSALYELLAENVVTMEQQGRARLWSLVVGSVATTTDTSDNDVAEVLS